MGSLLPLPQSSSHMDAIYKYFIFIVFSLTLFKYCQKHFITLSIKSKPYYSLSVPDLLVIVVQLLSRIWLSVILWTAAHHVTLSFTVSWSLLKFMSTELMMLCNHLILCCHLLLSPSILPSIRIFSNESALFIRWPKYWDFSFSISSFNEYPGLISFRID